MAPYQKPRGDSTLLLATDPCETSAVSKDESPKEAQPDAAAPPPAWRVALQIGASIVVLVGLLTIASRVFGPELTTAGRSFVDRFGTIGMIVGTFIADCFSLPPPPLFYIVLLVTAGSAHLHAMIGICAASVIGGLTGYLLAGRLARVAFFKRRIDRSRARFDRLFRRFGIWAFAIASALPVPYSVLCYIAGLYEIPVRTFLVLSLFRIPRLVVMYWLVLAGWMGTGA